MVPSRITSRRRLRRTTDRSLASAGDDRQVLVVGGGVAGLAVAAALRRAGYDPVVLTEPDRTSPSELATLHPMGQTVLDRLATGTDDRAGPGVVELDANETGGDEPGGRGRPAGTTTDAVRALLAATVPDEARRSDALRHVERDGDALRVRFESGVREWFDLAVAADGPASTVRTRQEGSLDVVEVTQVEARVATDDVSRRRAAWTGDGLFEALPTPGGDALVRVTTDPFDADSPATRLRRALDRLGVEACDPVDPVTRTVTQARGEGEWADGRVAYCGGAAFPQAPATGLRTTLALADARVFADELLAGPSSVATAVAAYGRRRRRHVRALRESVPRGSSARAVTPTDDPLAAVRRDRSAGFGDCAALAGVDRL